MDAPTRLKVWFHLGLDDARRHSGCHAWLHPWLQHSRWITHSHRLRVVPNEWQKLNQIMPFKASFLFQWTLCRVSSVACSEYMPKAFRAKSGQKTHPAIMCSCAGLCLWTKFSSRSSSLLILIVLMISQKWALVIAFVTGNEVLTCLKSSLNICTFGCAQNWHPTNGS